MPIILKRKFTSKKPHFEILKKKWTRYHNDAKQDLFDKHLRHIALGGLGGLMLLNTSNPHLPVSSLNNQTIGDELNVSSATSRNLLLAAELIDKLPLDARKLTDEEDKKVVELVEKNLKLKIVPELQNKRLNRTYGLIGGEQHLYRYPGDTVYDHMKDAHDWVMYGSAGIAPGLGAWGYFAPSKAALTPENELQERYYIAVQTFLSAGFAERVAEYRDFYKLRKMLIINPRTGQSVVAVIGDAGPSEWTGKHLGGSPEVMHELGLATGQRKGAVLYYFLDDPENKVPLGPVKEAAES